MPRHLLIALIVLLVSACSSAEGAGDSVFHWHISTVVEIDAPPEQVWAVLVDLPSYPEWNPFIVAASGTMAVGETLSLRMALPGRDPMTIRPRLLAVDPGRELRWKGRLLLPGIFDGEHTFVLTALADGRTRLDHWERFAGLLLPVARRMIYEDTVKSFHALNQALAKRATRNAMPDVTLLPSWSERQIQVPLLAFRSPLLFRGFPKLCHRKLLPGVTISPACGAVTKPGRQTPAGGRASTDAATAGTVNTHTLPRAATPRARCVAEDGQRRSVDRVGRMPKVGSRRIDEPRPPRVERPQGLAVTPGRDCDSFSSSLSMRCWAASRSSTRSAGSAWHEAQT